MQLPLIIGFGGINSAGRSSGYHAYNRLVFDELNNKQQTTTVQSLEALTGNQGRDKNLRGTLVRRLNEQWFAQFKNGANRQVSIDQETTRVRINTRQIPENLPHNWHIEKQVGQETIIRITNESGTALFPAPLEMATNAAAPLPDGFDPSSLYQSKNHPRSLQMAVFALSDCLGQSGLDWQKIQSLLPPDQISVYAGSSFGQFDNFGIGGLLKSSALGRRPTTKQIPLGYSQSPADFANAYILGNLGTTGASLGACSSFLYNLRQAADDIRSGKCHLAVAGASEAPLVPELIHGFQVMGALCSDKDLRQLDNLTENDSLDFRRACRPFGANAGFVMAESAQYFLLASPEFAASIGAQNFGAVADVFINADGYKKSISSTGAGNFLTLAKAAASVRSMLGESALQRHCFVHAHGTGTPLNRVTESYIINQIAKTFSIDTLPVVAIKGLIGHSQGAAAADQLATTLGTWKHKILPGITTTQQIAEDVEQSHLDILLSAKSFDAKVALLNAKGFGGNNATGVILSPEIVDKAMSKILGSQATSSWKNQQQKTIEKTNSYEQKARHGIFDIRYLFDNGVLKESDVTLTPEALSLPGYPDVRLDLEHGYGDIF